MAVGTSGPGHTLSFEHDPLHPQVTLIWKCYQSRPVCGKNNLGGNLMQSIEFCLKRAKRNSSVYWDLISPGRSGWATGPRTWPNQPRLRLVSPA